MNIKSRRESVHNVSEKDFELILEATQQAEEFNFDIDKLNFAMSQKGIRMPKFNSFEEFEEWLDRDDNE